MICNPILVQDLMQDKINLALKENLFSLQNLLDIYNGSLAKLLNKCLSMLKKHINHCKVFINYIFVFNILNDLGLFGKRSYVQIMQ